MAYELKKPEDEQTQGTLIGTAGQGVQDQSGQPIKTSGESGTLTGSDTGGGGTPNAPAAEAAAPTNESTTGTFKDIGNYLTQNQKQAQALAGRVAGQVSGELGKAGTEVGQYQTGLTGEMQKGVQQMTPEQQAKWEQTFGVGQGQVANQTTPYQPLSQEDIDAFKRDWAGQYAGPTDVTGAGGSSDLQKQYQTTNTDYQRALATAGLAGTAGGQQQLLTRLGGPRQSLGTLQLNQALLQNDPNAAKTISGAASGVKDVQAKWDALNSLAPTAYQNALTQQQQAQQAMQKAFDPTQIQNQAIAQGQANYQKYMDAYNQARAATEAQYSPHTRTVTDYDEETGEPYTYEVTDAAPNTYGVNWANDAYWGPVASQEEFVGGGQYGPSGYRGATADQIARYNALNQLEGQGGNLWDPNAFNAPTSPTFNQKQFDADVAQQKAIADANWAAAHQPAPAPQEQDNTLSGAAVGAAAGAAVAGPVGAIIGGIGGAIFCFTAGTPILMGDGTEKAVNELQLGDITHTGGTVTARGEAFSNNIYDYQGTYVDGDHAVLEDGTWIRVHDSKKASKIDLKGTYTVVYPIVTENHRLISNNITWTDMVETDQGWGASDEQRLEYLNKQEKEKNAA